MSAAQAGTPCVSRGFPLISGEPSRPAWGVARLAARMGPLRLAVLPLLGLSLAACNLNGTLVRTVTEPPGPNCPTGGIAVQTGGDTNGNGVLDDREVIAKDTRYVCNGTTTNVSITSAEPPGTNCPYGGAKLQTGVDQNGDGILEASEITATQYICNDTPASSIFVGNLVIQSQAQLSQLSGVQRVIGNLELSGDLGATASFPGLQIVSGGLSVDGVTTSATQLSFPDLQFAESLDFSHLATVQRITLPALTATDFLSVENDPALVELDAPLLGQTTGLELFNAPLLTTTQLPSLVKISGYLQAYQLPSYSHCEVEHLTVQGDQPAVYEQGTDLSQTCTAADECGKLELTLNNGDTAYQCDYPHTWQASQALCQQLGTGADLLWFESAAELAAFQALAQTHVLRDGSWLGYSRVAPHGAFAAVSPLAGSFDATAVAGFWLPGEPDDAGVGENYVQLFDSRGGMNEASLDGSLPNASFCRLPAGS